MTEDNQSPLYFDPIFLRLLGMFHGAWSSVDQTVDYAIGHFLNIPHQQTHRLTSGMMFGRKSQLLAGLIARSDHPKKDVLLGSLNTLRGPIKRDWIAHSYIVATKETVTFLYRNSGGEYKLHQLKFTLQEFYGHVDALVKAGERLQEAIGLDKVGLDEFVSAAASA